MTIFGLIFMTLNICPLPHFVRLSISMFCVLRFIDFVTLVLVYLLSVYYTSPSGIKIFTPWQTLCTPLVPV